MKTISEFKKSLPDVYESDFHVDGYQQAIEGILQDIQNTSVLSVNGIEKYLQDLLK